MMRAGPAPSVLITGANRGLGLELARQYAGAGARVFACCRDPKALPDEGDVIWKRLDTASEDSIATLAADLIGEPLDILINNAARRGDTGSLESLASDDFLTTIRVNTLGPLLMVKAFMPHLTKGARKLIANISSRAGSISEGLDPDGDYAYCCSKAALDMATAKLAFDHHHLIFLALHPGWVKTDMGGPDAEVPVTESAARLRALIDNAGVADSGTFRSFDGAAIAW
jgi:NAD(P)-dependent dehydrogenase (short-subunit alcohol dehydrogenase family)